MVCDTVKELCFKAHVVMDMKEGHGAQRIMKGTGGTVRSSQNLTKNILRQAAFRLWFNWTEWCTVKRAVQLACDITEAPCYYSP